jgi:hypothetical protein
MELGGSRRRGGRARNAAVVCACITLGVAGIVGMGGCEGAFYGGATGAYLVAGGGHGGCSSSGFVADGRYGSSGDIFLLGVIVIGASIGAIAEIVKWMSEGCR